MSCQAGSHGIGCGEVRSRNRHHVWFSISESIDQACDGLNGAFEKRKFRGENVKTRSVGDVGFREDVELEFGHGVLVGCYDRYSEISNGVNDCLGHHPSIAGSPENRLSRC
jgi:hypothetical protein